MNKSILQTGQAVKAGDIVYFINSDGIKCEDKIRERDFDCWHAETNKKLKKGSLFFWNNSFNISDYKNLLIKV